MLKRLEPAINVQGLSFGYSEEAILKGISLQVEPHEFVLVLGPSGCGKSTLAMCLNGLIPNLIKGEFFGSVRINGRDISQHFDKTIGTQVGILFQDPDSQISNLRVRDEIAFGCENLLLPASKTAERVESYAGMLGLSGLQESLCRELSYGQRQRVALASILAMEPHTLILDEPLSNLDCQGTKEFISFLGRLKAEGKSTVVLIEHKIDEILHLLDRVVVIDEGKVLLDGTPDAVFCEHSRLLLEEKGVWIPQLAEFLLHTDDLPVLPPRIGPVYEALRARYTFTSQPVPKKEIKESLISLKGVTAGYVKGRDILRGISLSFGRGEAIAVVGPNGSGKTTLGKLLVGLLKPSGGKLVMGCSAGYMFQNSDAQFLKFRVSEELDDALGGQSSPELVEETLSRHGLARLGNSNPLDLSLGEKKRLVLATFDPSPVDLLILDEPTMGLDFRGMSQLMELLERKKGQGTTMIVITHEMRFLTNFVDRTIVIDDGLVVADLSPQELFSSPELLARLSLSEPPVVALARRLGLEPVPLTPKDLAGCMRLR